MFNTPPQKPSLNAMFVCSFVRLFVCRQRVVVGHWLTGARVLLLAATRGRSDAWTPRQWMSHKYLPPCIYASGGCATLVDHPI